MSFNFSGFDVKVTDIDLSSIHREEKAVATHDVDIARKSNDAYSCLF